VKQNKDPFNWRSRALDEIRRGWFVYLVVVLLFAGMMAFYLREDHFLHASGEPIAAQIVSISGFNNRARLTLRDVTVVARASNGMTASRTVSSGLVTGCKIGDSVSAAVVEGRLRIEPLPCSEGRTNPKS